MTQQILYPLKNYLIYFCTKMKDVLEVIHNLESKKSVFLSKILLIVFHECQTFMHHI